MARTCTLLRRLASDAQLWRHYHFVRSPRVLKGLLFAGRRPNRVELVDRNILAGVRRDQLARGCYINGPTMQHHRSQQARVDRYL